jgi:hypothetical protein
MDTLMHADIFFFVTTIAVVVIALCFIVALFYVIAILNRIKTIAEMVREEATLFREDVHDLREAVKKEGFRLKNMFDFVTSFLGKKKSKGRNKD